jgi:hypothetical protein
MSVHPAIHTGFLSRIIQQPSASNTTALLEKLLDMPLIRASIGTFTLGLPAFATQYPMSGGILAIRAKSLLFMPFLASPIPRFFVILVLVGHVILSTIVIKIFLTVPEYIPCPDYTTTSLPEGAEKPVAEHLPASRGSIWNPPVKTLIKLNSIL